MAYGQKQKRKNKRGREREREREVTWRSTKGKSNPRKEKTELLLYGK